MLGLGFGIGMQSIPRGGSGPAPGPVVSDTFTRVDDNLSMGTAETGQVWTPLLGAWGIASNAAYPKTLDVNRAITVVESGISDIDISSDITWRVSEHIVFRATDSSNMLVAAISGTGLLLIRYQADVSTTLYNYAFTPVAGTKYALRVTAVGTVLNAYLDGTLRITGGSSFNVAATKHGYRCFSSPTSARFDNFKVLALAP